MAFDILLIYSFIYLASSKISSLKACLWISFVFNESAMMETVSLIELTWLEN